MTYQKQGSKIKSRIDMKFFKRIWKFEKEKDFWYQKAIDFFEDREYESAKNALEKNMQVNRKTYESLFLLGKIHYNLKNFEESLEFYNKALEQYQRNQLRNSVKIVKMKSVHKFEEALKYSDKIHQTEQIGQDYWYSKGLVLFNLGKFDKARSCFENGLEINQDNPKILYELAKSELKMGNKQKAYEILDKVCTIDQNVKEKIRQDKDFETLAR